MPQRPLPKKEGGGGGVGGVYLRGGKIEETEKKMPRIHYWGFVSLNEVHMRTLVKRSLFD